VSADFNHGSADKAPLSRKTALHFPLTEALRGKTEAVSRKTKAVSRKTDVVRGKTKSVFINL
jgi:hypothetical protein